MTPSDPATMMTDLAETHLTCEHNKHLDCYTCDLQLYHVALHLMWTYLDQFTNVIVHSHISFVSSISTLMAACGLAEVIIAVFRGVPKMVSGKRFTQNMRAL